jgi:hypothetical protein
MLFLANNLGVGTIQAARPQTAGTSIVELIYKNSLLQQRHPESFEMPVKSPLPFLGLPGTVPPVAVAPFLFLLVVHVALQRVVDVLHVLVLVLEVPHLQ